MVAGVFWGNYKISLTEETIVQQVHYTLLDTRMVEHTTDYSTDVIKMTLYSASWATSIICIYKETEQNA